ncbi:MAG: RHS repeat domain-containing protein [Mucilaginibacter sp.]|uniref:RHS repeat domain-containing protein n=1 Tax=Mucilaginibacter sp. TaxID=1882438 RepID=UPI0031B24FA3
MIKSKVLGICMVLMTTIGSPWFVYAQVKSSLAVQPGSGATAADYSKLTDILPPSPDAASLGKYGGLDIGLTTGVLNINIPIYQYVSNNLKLPVSLSYFSNGLKVDEIASRVGMSWSLNAGGVITRTVMGAADEKVQRLIPPEDFPQRTQNLINFVETLNVRDANDAEPDIFSFNFNGYTGKFLLDDNLNPVPLNHSALRIEKDFSETGSWNFKITTPAGEQYFFGGASATETTNKYQSGCGKSYASFVPTAWYLTQVIHPNRDTLNFKYDHVGYLYKTGVNEAMYAYSGNFSLPQGASYSPSAPPNTSCLSWLQTNTVYLQEINSTSGGKLKFLYTDRPDIGDKLLSAMEVYQRGKAVRFKYFSFKYQTAKASTLFSNVYTTADTSLDNRPFLTRISEWDSSGSKARIHEFSYNGLGFLPPRLSYAQDAYGYFNGAYNSTTLIPQPVYDEWQPALPGATANRNSDPVSATSGLLNRIKYPTGGYDSLVYEANTTYQQRVGNTPKITIYLTGVGIDQLAPNTLTSPPFQLSSNKSATLHAQCVYDPHSGNPVDELHNKCTVSVFDITAGTTVFTQILSLGQSINPDAFLLTSGHTYQLQIIPRGAGAQGSANLSYPDDTYVAPFENVPVAGLRISKVITTPGDNSGTAQIKHYYYYNPEDPTKSSGSRIFIPQFEKYLHVYSQSLTSSGGPICAPTIYDYYSMYSNSQTNLYAYSTPVNYTSVLESFGDNFENGGVEHHFQLQADIPGQSILGEPMPSAPLSDYSWRNGREFYTYTFKMNGSIKVPVQKVFSHYKEDTRVNQEYKSYIVNKKYSATCETSPPNQTQFDAYDLISYSHFCTWVYPDTVRTWTYNTAGSDYIEDINTSEYGNPEHALLTKSTSIAGDGQINTITLNYPQDIALTGAEETARLALIAQHNLSPVLLRHTTKGSAEVSTIKTSYLIYPNGLVLPHLYNVKQGSNVAEDRVVFNAYTDHGQVLSESLINGPSTGYIWDYDQLYPVAQIKNSDPADIAFTSFEADNTGNWIVGSAQRDSTTLAKTGRFSYPLSNGLVSKSGLTAATTYELSYWTKNGAPFTIAGTISGYPIKNATVNGWTNYIHRVSGVNSVSISGTGNIDELRLYPLNATMVTSTYEPSIGMTSTTDAKGKTTTYEYDSFQRLMNVKDENGNIIRHMDYHYQGQ